MTVYHLTNQFNNSLLIKLIDKLICFPTLLIPMESNSIQLMWNGKSIYSLKFGSQRTAKNLCCDFAPPQVRNQRVREIFLLCSMTIRSALCVSQIYLLLKILLPAGFRTVLFHSCPYMKTSEFHKFAGYNLYPFCLKYKMNSAVILWG